MPALPFLFTSCTYLSVLMQTTIGRGEGIVVFFLDGFWCMGMMELTVNTTHNGLGIFAISVGH